MRPIVAGESNAESEACHEERRRVRCFRSERSERKERKKPGQTEPGLVCPTGERREYSYCSCQGRRRTTGTKAGVTQLFNAFEVPLKRAKARPSASISSLGMCAQPSANSQQPSAKDEGSTAISRTNNWLSARMFVLVLVLVCRARKRPISFVIVAVRVCAVPTRQRCGSVVHRERLEFRR